ncbi:MAG TPA: hypothetical protein PLX02_12700 [Syntrophorhabdaceae bacterium]|nr:hypothetical protein [Syntrophorhabdaceae bacterium]HQM82472.1 hypothetical protein [Syntrophorhabdaceae bacterium]
MMVKRKIAGRANPVNRFQSLSKSKASAVRIAVNEYLKKKKAEKIKSMKGLLEFDMTAQEVRHYER